MKKKLKIMYSIFEYLLQFFIFPSQRDSCDDFVDRLNRKYTVAIILAFVTILTSKQYIGEPLACFCPAHFTGAHVEYTNNICWISKSFFVPIESASNNNKIQKKISDNFNFRLNGDLKFKNNSNMKFTKIENIITYYPFLLLLQAILFYFPYFCWKNIVTRSVYDIDTLIKIALDSQKCKNQKGKEILLNFLVKHLQRSNEYYMKYKVLNFKTSTKNLNNGKVFNKYICQNKKFNFKRIISFLTMKPGKKREDMVFKNQEKHETSNLKRYKYIGLFSIYLIIKVLYIVNCFGQFLILNILLSREINFNESNETNTINQRNDFTFTTNTNIANGILFGFKTIKYLIENGNLFGDHNRILMFHSVIFCDFKIRMLGDRLHRHTVQCVVPVNIFTEKIFTIIWFWFLILSITNIFNLIIWSLFYISKKIRLNFLKRHLLLSDLSFNKISRSDKSKTGFYSSFFQGNISKNDFEINIIENMANNNLLTDNIFIIKLISKNSNEILTRELVTLMVNNFKENYYFLCGENTV